MRLIDADSVTENLRASRNVIQCQISTGGVPSIQAAFIMSVIDAVIATIDSAPSVVDQGAT